MNKIHFLAPYGATFTMKAAQIFANKYGLNFFDPTQSEYVPAEGNHCVIPHMITQGGYGVLAFETLAEGPVVDSLESLMTMGANQLHIIAALRMPISFNLMARRDVQLDHLQGIVAHPKSFGACQEITAQMRLPLEMVLSNGEAARLIAEDPSYTQWATIGPDIAGSHYQLNALRQKCEDRDAVTTFYLLGPNTIPSHVGEFNRAVIGVKTSVDLDQVEEIAHTCIGAKHLEVTQTHRQIIDVVRKGTRRNKDVALSNDRLFW